MDDIQLYCQRAGQGHPLILLHGNGEDHTYFAPLIPRFAAFRRVYALDTRGHGHSPPGGTPPSPSSSLPGICWPSWTGRGSNRRTCWASATGVTSPCSSPWNTRSG